MLRGYPVATFQKRNSIDYTVRAWVQKEQIDSMEKILTTLIDTPHGKIPLNKIAVLQAIKEPTNITREGLSYTLEIYGNREKSAISHIMKDFNDHLSQIDLPQNVEIEQISYNFV